MIGTSNGLRTASLDTASPDAGSEAHTKLTHLTSNGEAHMVSIAEKKSTQRAATAMTVLVFSKRSTYEVLAAARLRKGDALAVARIAGIQAAKKTADLIPLAHPGLNITGASVGLEPFQGDAVPPSVTLDAMTPNPRYGGVHITATVACEGKTGVEMEAIVAASVAGLTVYDMLKGEDKAMSLTQTRVIAKSGGKSGDWRWHPQSATVIRGESGLGKRGGG